MQTYLGEKCCAVDMDFEGTELQPDFGAKVPIQLWASRQSYMISSSLALGLMDLTELNYRGHVWRLSAQGHKSSLVEREEQNCTGYSEFQVPIHRRATGQLSVQHTSHCS